MSFKNIPVLILNNMTLFPSTDVRLDFDSTLDRNIINISETHFGGQILIVNKEDPLEVNPSFDELLKVGVLAQITMKMELPNNNIRITFAGIKRVRVDSFYNEDSIIYAKYSNTLLNEIDTKDEIAYSRMLKRLVDEYVSNIPYTSNALINTIRDINELDILTDVIAASFEFSMQRKVEYVQEFNQMNRAIMLMEDIRQDFEIVEIEKNIDEEVSKRLDKSQKEFILREKVKVIKEEIGDISDKDSDVEEIREKINSINCSDVIRNKLLKELKRYESFPSFSPEVSVIRNYIDLMLELPWNVYTEEEKDMDLIKSRLDESHYGMEEVKNRILEYIALKKWTDNEFSPVLCLVGPPGVGKTTLAKSIADALGKKYCKISVGGIQDEADIVGHRRTYIGSMPGMIINGIKKSRVSDPVFIIDEIDKMTKTIKGDPASSLLEVLDKEQNSKFVDHYIEEEYDLSKVMFITTANYIDQIPLELLDRLEIIEISSYTEVEKLNIAKYYLIKNKLIEYKLKNIDFTDDAIYYIIRNYTLESGVRELDRVISKILRKLIRKGIPKKKIVVDVDMVVSLLGKELYDYIREEEKQMVGVVNGLSYTPLGGDTLKIEATMFKGKGNLVLTGSLGDVIKESSILAINYIKTNASKFGVSLDTINKNDIHLHFPEGAVKKDGPSAGIAIVTVLLSVLKNEIVRNDIAMTGEITLRGRVLPIGGLKEKVIGAKRRGINKVFIPRANKKDVDDIPEEVRNGIEFIYVDVYNDIYKKIFKNAKTKIELDDDCLIKLDI